MGRPARGVALPIVGVILASIVIGNSLPEFGDVLAIHLKWHPHAFNIVFLVLSIIGFIYSLRLGHRIGSEHSEILVVKMKKNIKRAIPLAVIALMMAGIVIGGMFYIMPLLK